MNKPLIMLGAGGHASVLIDILRSQGRTPIAVVAPDLDKSRSVFSGIKHWQDDNELLRCRPDEYELVNGIGSLPGNPLRAELFARFRELGYRFASVISSQTILSDYAILEEGVQIMSGAVLQTGCRIGYNSIINTGAIVDHDCHIGNDNHIAPSAVLCGGVKTGAGVHVGTHATVIQGIIIGASAVVGAGATLTKNLGENQIAYVARGSVMPVKQ